MYGRFDSTLFSPEVMQPKIDDLRARERERVRRMVDRFENPPPTAVEFVAESGSNLVERWKQQTRDRIAKDLGVTVNAPKRGERDELIYPPHVLLASAIITPFVQHVALRKERIVDMLWSTGILSAADLRLYQSMTLREQRNLEDGFLPVPSSDYLKTLPRRA